MDWDKNIYGKPRLDVKKQEKKLEESSISAKNKEQIKAFIENLVATQNIGNLRINKLYSMLRVLAIEFNRDFSEVTKEDVTRILCKINMGEFNKGKARSAETQIDYKKLIKRFFKWLYGGENLPDIVKGIATKHKIKDKNSGLGGLLTQQDVDKLIASATTPRDKAFLKFSSEVGGRIGETLSMSVGDYVDKGRYAEVVLKGKTGERRVVIRDSIPEINMYLASHPYRYDHTAPFWLSLGTYRHGQELKYNGVKKMLITLFKRAKVKRPHKITHCFRFFRASTLASVLPEMVMEDFFGWERGSQMPRVYCSLSGKQVRDVVLEKVHGIKAEDKIEEKPRTINCIRCGKANNSNAKFCYQCGQAFTMEAVNLIKDEEDKKLKLLCEIMGDPALKKEFEEWRINKNKKEE